ncbi:MAG: hypothetical protein KAR42_14115 [candidate division Zixibacteria bacterium]|nr:hypothetical protein [candidate division Zixibacteria bacterium]
MKDINLKELERRAYRSTFDDGIYDIYFGLLFLIIAWIPIMESIGISRVLGYPLLVSPIALIWAGKRFITIPRLGAVEFGTKRKTYKKIVRWIGLISLALMLPLMIMFGNSGLTGNHEGMSIWLMIAIIGLPVFAIAVAYINHPRIFIYAAAMIFCVAQAEFLLRFISSPLNSIVTFGLVGIIVFVYGLSLLIAFIKKYPKESPEVNHVG